MKKSDSIKYMMELGFNVLDCFITRDQDLAKDYLSLFPESCLMSMRTERGYEFLCPFFYGQKPLDLFCRVDGLTSQGYTLLIYPFLPWQDCLAFGTVGLPKTGGTVIEYVLGPGLLRDLDTHKEKKIYEIGPGKLMFIPNQPLVNEVLQDINQKAGHLTCVVEWSYYRYPVGLLNQPIIYWEVRDYA